MGLLDLLFPKYAHLRQERLGALLARDEEARQSRLVDARERVAHIPDGSEITHLFLRLLDAPRHPLLKGQGALRRERAEITADGRTLSPLYFGSQTPPTSGPRTYFMGCSKEELDEILKDKRVEDVFDTLNIAFIMYPQWKHDLATKGYFTVDGLDM